MKAVLLIDFGSTYTKITAVDVDEEKILGTAQSYTTIETDIINGLNNALAILKEKIGDIQFEEQYACSSAAGGLRMVAIGLVPELTAKAARQASLGAGAKVIKTYSYELTEGDLEEIDRINPDICLLTGGTDGGNKENIVFNARMLAKAKNPFPIIIAGNRNCADQCQEILKEKQTYVCENVMPRLDIPNVEPVQKKIREIFLEQIVKAKGLSRAQQLVQGILMPTPSAMLTAMRGRRRHRRSGWSGFGRSDHRYLFDVLRSADHRHDSSQGSAGRVCKENGRRRHRYALQHPWHCGCHRHRPRIGAVRLE